MSVLALTNKRGPMRVEGSLVVINVLGKMSLDLTDAEVTPGSRVHVVTLLGVADVRLPAAGEVTTRRLSLGRTRVNA